MANAGGAWDNAKKIVEVELKMKGTPLHAATVVGDTVGDPFKDTSSVAMNPVIKFTTLFGLLAVELAVSLTAQQGSGLTSALAAVFFWPVDGLRVAVVLRHADPEVAAGCGGSRIARVPIEEPGSGRWPSWRVCSQESSNGAVGEQIVYSRGC